MACSPRERSSVPTPTPLPPSDPSPRGPGRGGGKRGYRLVRHFKLDQRLTPEDRAAYDALLRDPRSTIDSLLKWLHDNGYPDMTRGGVHRHRKHFEHIAGEIQHDARVAGVYATIARDAGGIGALEDAAQFRLEQMFLEQLFRMKKTDRRTGKEWGELARVIRLILENRGRVEEQRAERAMRPKPER
jgi:hypothetical protein